MNLVIIAKHQCSMVGGCVFKFVYSEKKKKSLKLKQVVGLLDGIK